MTVIIRITMVLMVAVCFMSRAFSAEKIVSLDYCADQFVLTLADRDQIMALSNEATDSHSFYADRAKGIAQFGATTEEVLYMKPDLVVRNWGGDKFLNILEKANIPVASIRYGRGIDMLYDNLRHVGEALGQGPRAEELITDHQQRYNKLRGQPPTGLRAVYITPSGVTAGTGTFVNDILRFAGLRSVAQELGLAGWQAFPLEALVHNPPDIIVGSFFDLDALPMANWSLARHGRIKKMMEKIPTIMVPGRYLSCNGIFTLEAAEYIRKRVRK